MAATSLNTSTLSEALSKTTNNFAVGATTNITVGCLLVIAGTGGLEIVKVQAIPSSGRVQVIRGWAGSRVRPHASGTRFFIGDPDDFQNIRTQAANIVGDAGNFPEYPIPGLRAKDGAGNEYVLCEAAATIYGGVTVGISNDGLYTCVPLKGGTHQGSVGVSVEPGTTDQMIWIQVYGYYAAAQKKTATTGVTSDNICTATTTVSTPDVGLEPVTATSTGVYLIYGMFCVGVETSTVTSATSATGFTVPVFLNYPYVINRLDSIDTSNS